MDSLKSATGTDVDSLNGFWRVNQFPRLCQVAVCDGWCDELNYAAVQIRLQADCGY